MRPTDAPKGLRDDLQSWASRTLNIVGESMAETASELVENWDEDLPEDVTNEDVILWLTSALTDAMRDFTTWRVARAKSMGMSSIRVANDLDKRTAGNLRQLFPESIAVEESISRGDDRHQFESGLTLFFDDDQPAD